MVKVKAVIAAIFESARQWRKLLPFSQIFHNKFLFVIILMQVNVGIKLSLMLCVHLCPHPLFESQLSLTIIGSDIFIYSRLDRFSVVFHSMLAVRYVFLVVVYFLLTVAIKFQWLADMPSSNTPPHVSWSNHDRLIRTHIRNRISGSFVMLSGVSTRTFWVQISTPSIGVDSAGFHPSSSLVVLW